MAEPTQEEQWLNSNDPQWMLERLDSRAGANNRKLQLFIAACCRYPEISEQLEDYYSENADLANVAEQISNDFPTQANFNLAVRDAEGDHRYDLSPRSDWLNGAALHTGGFANETYDCYADFREACDNQAAFQTYALGVIRDIVGNPYRHVAFDPSWNTSTVRALAQQMYESCDFNLMPILADALQDAGCDNADILDHCRGPGPHVRGCWVVDMILGRYQQPVLAPVPVVNPTVIRNEPGGPRVA